MASGLMARRLPTSCGNIPQSRLPRTCCSRRPHAQEASTLAAEIDCQFKEGLAVSVLDLWPCCRRGRAHWRHANSALLGLWPVKELSYSAEVKRLDVGKSSKHRRRMQCAACWLCWPVKETLSFSTRWLGPVCTEDKTCMPGGAGQWQLTSALACHVQQAVCHTRGPADKLYKGHPQTGSKRSLLR